MILALSEHLAAVFMINVICVMFIAFGMKRILFNMRYEDDVDKRVISLFIIGVLFFTLGIITDTLSMMGMSTYLINSLSSVTFKTLAPLCFAIGAFFLRADKS